MDIELEFFVVVCCLLFSQRTEPHDRALLVVTHGILFQNLSSNLVNLVIVIITSVSEPISVQNDGNVLDYQISSGISSQINAMKQHTLYSFGYQIDLNVTVEPGDPCNIDVPV